MALADWPEDRLIALGVYAKGFEGDPELFYVYTNARDLTVEEERQLEAAAGAFGALTKLTFRTLMSPPTPQFVATGVAEKIVAYVEDACPRPKRGTR